MSETINFGTISKTVLPGPKKYPYYVEMPVAENRVERFLEAFAAVLRYSDYKPLLGVVPCYRSGLLLDTYEHYFTIGGWRKSRPAGGFELTEEIIDEMADGFYRCTACRRCTRECPLSIDHALVTHLGRYILS